MPTMRELLAGSGMFKDLDNQFFPNGTGELLQDQGGSEGFDFGAARRLQGAELFQQDLGLIGDLEGQADPFSALRARAGGFEAFRRQDTGEIDFAKTSETPFFETGEGGVFTGDDGTIRGQSVGGGLTDELRAQLTSQLESQERDQTQAGEKLRVAREALVSGQGTARGAVAALDLQESQRQQKEDSDSLRQLLSISNKISSLSTKDLTGFGEDQIRSAKGEVDFLKQMRRGILERLSPERRDQLFGGIGQAEPTGPTAPTADQAPADPAVDQIKQAERRKKAGAFQAQDLLNVVSSGGISSSSRTGDQFRLALREVLAEAAESNETLTPARLVGRLTKRVPVIAGRELRDVFSSGIDFWAEVLGDSAAGQFFAEFFG